MNFTNRQLRRIEALAKQISDSGYFIQCYCGDPACYNRVTPRDRAAKIVAAQKRTLKLNQEMIDAALRRVQLI